MLHFVLVSSVLLNLLCVWILFWWVLSILFFITIMIPIIIWSVLVMPLCLTTGCHYYLIGFSYATLSYHWLSLLFDRFQFCHSVLPLVLGLTLRQQRQGWALLAKKRWQTLSISWWRASGGKRAAMQALGEVVRRLPLWRTWPDRRTSGVRRRAPVKMNLETYSSLW